MSVISVMVFKIPNVNIHLRLPIVMLLRKFIAKQNVLEHSRFSGFEVSIAITESEQTRD